MQWSREQYECLTGAITRSLLPLLLHRLLGFDSENDALGSSPSAGSGASSPAMDDEEAAIEVKRDIDIAVNNQLGVEFADRVVKVLMDAKRRNKQRRGVSKEPSRVPKFGVVMRNPERSKHLETATMNINGFSLDFVNLRTEQYSHDSRTWPRDPAPLSSAPRQNASAVFVVHRHSLIHSFFIALSLLLCVIVCFSLSLALSFAEVLTHCGKHCPIHLTQSSRVSPFLSCLRMRSETRQQECSPMPCLAFSGDTPFTGKQFFQVSRMYTSCPPCGARAPHCHRTGPFCFDSDHRRPRSPLTCTPPRLVLCVVPRLRPGIPTMAIGSPAEDAYRRDLTINALFYNLHTGLVEDHTSLGLLHLKQRLIATPLAAKVMPVVGGGSFL